MQIIGLTCRLLQVGALFYFPLYFPLYFLSAPSRSSPLHLQ